MSSILINQKTSKRSLTLNKSFVLSVTFHTLLIFGVTFTTFYKLPLIENSPIINVKFANSSQDSFGNVGKSSAEVPNINKSQDNLINKEINRSVYQAHKIKKFQSLIISKILYSFSIFGSKGANGAASSNISIAILSRYRCRTQP